MKTLRCDTIAVVLCILNGLTILTVRAEDARAALYFPPHEGAWATVEPASIGWDAAELNATLAYAGSQESSGVVILYNGRILAERHWDKNPKPTDAQGQPNRYFYMRKGTLSNGHALEDVASVQKSIVSVLVGMAQHQGLLKIEDPVHTYLGNGWSKASVQQEVKISIRHLISMSSGLAVRLQYEKEPSTKWLYNTPAYSMSLRAVAAAAGKSHHELSAAWVTGRIGMNDSSWQPRPWAGERPTANTVGFVTTARDLARFGLLIQAEGKWAGKTVIADRDYLRESLRPSQEMNPRYGYLWWLNRPYAVTRGDKRVQVQRIPAAPADLVSANGALGRRLYVVPSLGLVVTRLGDAPGKTFDNVFWKRLMAAAPDSKATFSASIPMYSSSP